MTPFATQEPYKEKNDYIGTLFSGIFARRMVGGEEKDYSLLGTITMNACWNIMKNKGVDGRLL